MKYDYTNPKRFFSEPLMRYIWTSMIGTFILIAPLAIIAGIMDDGGKYLVETYPFTNYIVLGWLCSCVPLLITYTILYYARGWGDKIKWRM